MADGEAEANKGQKNLARTCMRSQNVCRLQFILLLLPETYIALLRYYTTVRQLRSPAIVPCTEILWSTRSFGNVYGPIQAPPYPPFIRTGTLALMRPNVPKLPHRTKTQQNRCPGHAKIIRSSRVTTVRLMPFQPTVSARRRRWPKRNDPPRRATCLSRAPVHAAAPCRAGHAPTTPSKSKRAKSHTHRPKAPLTSHYATYVVARAPASPPAQRPTRAHVRLPAGEEARHAGRQGG